MSVAGASAGARARHLLAEAAADPAGALALRAEAARFAVAERTEAQTLQLLSDLTADGFHFLTDRRWPGSKNAQVDLILVGRAGVFIVDTKAWREFSIENGRPHRGDEDVADTFDSLGSLLDGAQEAFAEVGLPPSEVHCIAAMTLQPTITAQVGVIEVIGVDRLVDNIRRRGARLTPADAERVAAVARDYFALLPSPDPTPSALLIEERPEQAPLFDLATFHQGLLHLDDAPIETWMSYLDPAQARIARRSFNGPARIRGAAGTGKTVVGLHRTAHLARRSRKRVLVTTYVRTFPAVLESLLQRLEPAHAAKVEFAGVHAFAHGILTERKVPFRVDQGLVNSAWWRAWRDLPESHPLRSSKFSVDYWRDEVDHVIKGRGLLDFDQYATVARVGRKYRLPVELRQHVWELAEAYDRNLRSLRVMDWADLIRTARDELLERPLDRYDAVLIDEAQDLTSLSVGMLHALVGDRQDGLTLIGDGQQSIYPGGYTLSEVGISLAGRGVVLDVNHRNTREIAEFARRLVADDIVTDIEGTDAPGDTVAAITRSGPKPVLRRSSDHHELDRLLLEALRTAIDRGRARTGDIGILTPSNASADRLLKMLRRDKLAAISVESYRGQTSGAIKVGTIKRAKGLEFKHVFLTDIPSALLVDPPEDAPDSALERRRLDLRELYVGMTRARDELWVGVSN